jgi:hypothetical protein
MYNTVCNRLLIYLAPWLHGMPSETMIYSVTSGVYNLGLR